MSPLNNDRPSPRNWPHLRRLLTERRKMANRALARLLDAEQVHNTAKGPRTRLGKWVNQHPVGDEAITYAQSDLWRAEGLQRLRSARIAEGASPGAMAELTEAAEAYNVAQQLISGATDLLHAIAARDASRPPPVLG